MILIEYKLIKIKSAKKNPFSIIKCVIDSNQLNCILIEYNPLHRPQFSNVKFTGYYDYEACFDVSIRFDTNRLT